MMHLRHPRRTATAALFALALATSAATAQSPSVADQAAEAFDRGVKHFERAEYEAAAKAFARADELLPAANALKNGIAAARKAGAYLLVAELAARAEKRAASDPELAAQAREAVAEARQKLAWLELSCKPEPCSLTLDEEPIEAGKRFVLPGSHTLRASADGGAKAEERVSLAAGTTYTVTLHPVAQGAARIPAKVQKSDPDGAPVEDQPAARKPLSPTVFWVGVGVSVALAGATAFSGLDALNAKNDLGDNPTSGESDDVHAKVLRTDLLLLGTAVVGGLTAYAGFSLVDWEGGSAKAAVVPTHGGAFASVEASF
jgi:hypothetical protein